MIYLHTMFAELVRRRGRTILTALGLGVGVGLVVTVGALSAGLDKAQQSVLEPLTGIGTDMTATRPIAPPDANGQGGFAGLSDAERTELRQENGGPGRVDFSKLEAGSTFTNTSFMSAQLSMAEKQVASVAKLDGVSSTAGGLTLNLTTVSGTVPDSTDVQQGGGFGGPPGGSAAGGQGGGPGGFDFSSKSVAGVDQTHPSLGALTSGQITKGKYFTDGDTAEAIVSESYAASNDITLGDTLKLKGRAFTVVGIAATPVGGTSYDVYVKLDQLQKLAGRESRVNAIYVRADSAADVTAVSAAIEKTISGSSVATAESLANSISGSLVSAKDLVGKLGGALQIVALLGAVLIASLLTLSSVAKRTRELGTLRAIGWSKGLVVRQITGESFLQSLLGAGVGVVIGVVGALLVTAFAPTLDVSFGGGDAAATGGPGGRPGGFVGQGAVDAASTAVKLSPDISPALIAGAVALAIAGGLVAGAIGALRASRLRPAVALRQID